MSIAMTRAMTSIRLFAIAIALAACSNPITDATSATRGSAAPTDKPSTKQEPPATHVVDDPGFGDVAFKTFRGDNGYEIEFTTKSKVEHSWPNMAGPTVHGTYEQHGPEIEIHWDPKYKNVGSSAEKLHQMGPCSMARYSRVDRVTGKTQESTIIYQQARPRCDTVRLTR